MYWYWIIIAICFLLSAFFSSADMVYSVVDKEKLAKRAPESKTAKLALYLAEDYDFSIASILFGNNVVNILASSLLTILMSAKETNYSVAVANIIFTILLIIFAEFFPKAIAKNYSYRLSLIFAYPVFITKILTSVIVWPIAKLFSLFGRLFRKRSKQEDVVNSDELNEMVDEIEDSGKMDEEEAELVHGAIDIEEKEAFEIMTPRVDVFALDIEEDIHKVMEEGEIFHHSRIPVYEDTIDNIIGILPIKALARATYRKETIDVRKLMYQPLKIPRNKSLLDLLNEFKKSKIHIAVVMDEYGGTDGIITMEDILEEMVGDIFDETDDELEDYIDQGNGTYIVDGSMNLNDFFELIEYHGEFETGYNTVSGFCQEMLQRFAIAGDEFLFENRYLCRVIDASEYTVERLLVSDQEFEIEEEK